MRDPLKLAYGTYAMQNIDPFDAITGIKEIGYDALELNSGEAWPTAPGKLDADYRKRLRDALQSADFPSPVLMNVISLGAHDEDTDDKVRLLAGTCQLAGDLNFDDRPRVMTTTLGHRPGTWDETRDDFVEALQPYVQVAEDHGVILAIEAHAGQEFDSPEKSVWLVEAVDRPSVRLNFDHSHFHVAGMEIEHCANLMAPYSVHTHLKDGFRADGKVKYLLPGDGDLDLERYFRAVSAAGIEVPITVEVSGQISNLEDYDPWATARACYESMRAGMEKAGV
jgi:sugar phosphate isomerase/epimerase